MTECRVVRDKETGRGRGFGFVTFSRPEEAEAACVALNGYQLHERQIRIDRSEPKTGRPRDGSSRPPMRGPDSRDTYGDRGRDYRDSRDVRDIRDRDGRYDGDRGDRDSRSAYGVASTGASSKGRGPVVLDSTVCYSFQRGDCKYGTRCRFSHDLSTLASKPPPSTNVYREEPRGYDTYDSRPSGPMDGRRPGEDLQGYDKSAPLGYGAGSSVYRQPALDQLPPRDTYDRPRQSIMPSQQWPPNDRREREWRPGQEQHRDRISEYTDPGPQYRQPPPHQPQQQPYYQGDRPAAYNPSTDYHNAPPSAGPSRFSLATSFPPSDYPPSHQQQQQQQQILGSQAGPSRLSGYDPVTNRPIVASQSQSAHVYTVPRDIQQSSQDRGAGPVHEGYRPTASPYASAPQSIPAYNPSPSSASRPPQYQPTATSLRPDTQSAYKPSPSQAPAQQKPGYTQTKYGSY